MNASTGDLSQLVANFTAASGGSFQANAAEIIRASAQKIADEAAKLAPKKTGALANSITTVFPTPTTAIIGPTKKYGVFQEFGTATRGEFPGSAYIIRPVRASHLVFQVNGKTVYAREVHHPGIPHHPFMRPATAHVLNDIQRQLGQAGVTFVAAGKP